MKNYNKFFKIILLVVFVLPIFFVNVNTVSAEDSPETKQVLACNKEGGKWNDKAGRCLKWDSYTCNAADGNWDKNQKKCFTKPGKICLQVAIPGMKSIVKTTYDADKDQYCFTGHAGNYISALYVFAVYLAGLLSVVMLILGGLKWISSNGNAEGITAGKTRFISATMGLVLVLGAFLILKTFNDNLVQIDDPNMFAIEKIKPEFFYSDAFCTSNGSSNTKFGKADQSAGVFTLNALKCGKKYIAVGDSAQTSCLGNVCAPGKGVCVRNVIVNSSFADDYYCEPDPKKVCGAYDDDLLAESGLSESDSGCKKFEQWDYTKKANEHTNDEFFCWYSEDTNVDILDDSCVAIFPNCKDVKECGDYDNKSQYWPTKVYGYDDLDDLESEIRRVCLMNPCGAGGPAGRCRFKDGTFSNDCVKATN